MGSKTEVEAVFHGVNDGGTTSSDPRPHSAPQSDIPGIICVNVIKQVISTQEAHHGSVGIADLAVVCVRQFVLATGRRDR